MIFSILATGVCQLSLIQPVCVSKTDLERLKTPQADSPFTDNVPPVYPVLKLKTMLELSELETRMLVFLGILHLYFNGYAIVPIFDVITAEKDRVVLMQPL